MKKALYLILLLTVTTASANTIGPGFGYSRLFNDKWLFSLSDQIAYADINFDDSNWRTLNLPHDWSIEGQLSQDNASCTGYLPAGVAWYRKHFNYSPDVKKPLTFIYFEGVYNRSEVYLNGHLLGKRPNGYVSFLYDMTPYLNNGENVIAVRVDHSRIADSRWYTGSGIYRDVYLVEASNTHLKQWGTTYWLKRLENNKALVEVTWELDNKDKTSEKLQTLIKIIDQQGVCVAEKPIDSTSELNSVDLQIDNPKLWSIDKPNLYVLSLEVKANGKTIDQTTIDMGLRNFEFNPNWGLKLNDINLKVKGVCLHHDAGVLGTVVPEQVWRRRVRKLKEMGANAIRMSHNIQAPILYDICDELGMLIMDEASDEWEFPKRKWIKGWNQGEPGFDGTYDFFEEWIDIDVKDMVLRDRNHPSVFLWSIGNEVDYPNDPYSHPVLDGTTINQPMFGGYKKDAPNAERIGFIAKRLAEIIRTYDTTRLVTGALAGVVMSNQTIYPEVIDVVGYNYTEDRYQEDHKTYPERIIFGSETHSDYKAWRAVKDNDFIFGQFIWTGTDYLGESGKWPSRGLNTGLLNFGSFKKPRGWFRTALWTDIPMIYVGTYPYRNMGRRNGRNGNREFLSIDAFDSWNYEEGRRVKVVAYTNAPKARLKLNGMVVGEIKEYNDTTGIIAWDVDYEEGTLTAEALDYDDSVIATYDINTATQPVALKVIDLTDEGLAKNEKPEDARLLQLLVQIIDEDGNVVKNANNEITCNVDDNATLLGMEASNNTDMSDYTDNRQNAFRGEILVYVRKKSNDKTTITFTSQDLQPIQIIR